MTKEDSPNDVTENVEPCAPVTPATPLERLAEKSGRVLICIAVGFGLTATFVLISLHQKFS